MKKDDDLARLAWPITPVFTISEPLRDESLRLYIWCNKHYLKKMIDLDFIVLIGQNDLFII